MPEITAFAYVPGLPLPQVDGAHYDAEKAYVQAHGLPRPVLVDRAGVAWAGRTLANICYDLAIEPIVQVVDDGMAAAIQELAQRDLTVLEQADFVLAAHDRLSTGFVLDPSAKRSQAVSAWFKQVLGKERGFSPSQVEQYLRVARAPVEVRRQLKKAGSLHQAIRLLKQLEQPCDSAADSPASTVEVPSAEEEAALTAATAFMEKLQHLSQLTVQGRETLAALRTVLSDVLKRSAPHSEKAVAA